MSGKFMNVKRIIIPTITMVIIASSLMGCAAASQDELLNMMHTTEQIEVEVATPKTESEDAENTGVEQIDWIELQALDTYPELREQWNSIVLLADGNGGTFPGFFANAQNEKVDNNTFRAAMNNNAILGNYLEIEQLGAELLPAVESTYTDVDADDFYKTMYAGLNAYFNILPDKQSGVADMDSTLQRNEFMAMVFRADTPVQELTKDNNFTASVGDTEYNIYAQGLAGNSYLDTKSKSLDDMTYTSSITRAEAIYMLVTRYQFEEYDTLDLERDNVTFTDAKDGGDIAKDQGIDKTKDYWKSDVLNYALQNPDKGLPTDLYKALVVAAREEIIDPTVDTRWDEALTKADAMELLCNAYMHQAEAEWNTLTTDPTDPLALVDPEDISEFNPQFSKYDIYTVEDFNNKWKDFNTETATEEERQEYAWNMSSVLKNRPQEEKEADVAEDQILGYDLKIEEDTGLSYLVDKVTGKEYHFGDTFPNGTVYRGQNRIRADVIHDWRDNNPDDTRTDEEILSMFLKPEGGYIQ